MILESEILKNIHNVNTDIPVFVNKLKIESKSHNYIRVNTKWAGKNLIVYVIDTQEHVSKFIIQQGSWDTEWIANILVFMKKYEGIQLLDIGSNLGIYTLPFAAHGFKVIAIDANKNTTDRLMQSIIANKLQDNVILILNALSYVRKNVSMDVVADSAGSQRVIYKLNSWSVVKSILMDDLLPYTDPDKPIFIKMDIEGGEANALKEASKLFSQREIIGIFMEWLNVKLEKDCYILIYFLMSRNYRPFPDFSFKHQLDISNYGSWPPVVLWIKM